MLRLVKAETYKLSKKLKSWLGPLLIMVLVLIAFPLSIDISQFDLDKFYFSIIVVSLSSPIKAIFFEMLIFSVYNPSLTNTVS